MSISPHGKPDGIAISSRYRILRKLGSGSFGTVYLAHDENAGRPVALKVLRPERLKAEEIEHLQSEFRSFASLRHPQIASAYDFGYTEERNLPFYTREYIDGEPLGPGPSGGAVHATPLEMLQPIFDILDALRYLHAHDILHLDIHAGNVIVARERGRGAVLIDFGLLRPPGSPSSPSLLEVRRSMPPELIEGKSVGPEADLYAVGKLLLYRLTGGREGEARLPREVPGWGPRLTLEIERIAAKAIQSDPGQRFRSAAEFQKALAAALGEPGGGPRAIDPGEVTVGRDRELEAIEEALRRAAAGGCAVLWFAGPAGIGKTRLLTEARWRAQMRGLEVAGARFVPVPAAEPQLTAALGSARSGRRSHSRWLEPLSPEHGGTSQERARRAAAAYFAEEGAPAVILLDDFDVADRHSRTLAEALLAECARRQMENRTGRGLAILGASARPPEGGAAPPRLCGAIRSLKPLPAAAARSLLRAWLRPLEAGKTVVARFAAAAGGNPLRLRQIARAAHALWGRSGFIPRGASPPPAPRQPSASRAARDARWNPIQRRILQALAVLGRPAKLEEIAAAAELDPEAVAQAVRTLLACGTLDSRGRGRLRLYHFADPEEGAPLAAELTARRRRRMHRRLADFFRRFEPGDRRAREFLARHLLAAGKRQEGRRAILETAGELRRRGLLAGAIQLLSEAARDEPSRRWRLRLAEEASALLEQYGDHQEGIAILEPAYRGELGRLSGRVAVRIRRRLGVHYHRAGRAQEAADMLEEVRALADPERDLEELALVESELAELHTLRGQYTAAEAACRRGLDLLRRSGGRAPGFRADMEVTLRASLGHLELRQMALRRARDEYEAALRLARSRAPASIRALILNNLGIVHNQLDDFPRARGCFLRAEQLLRAAGEAEELIKISCNLAVIAAKTGDAAGAAERLERAANLLQAHPGGRAEFFTLVSRGTVAHILGDMSSAAAAFEAALPLGRRLGDLYLVRFCEVYLGEVHLACGRYGEALKLLRASAARAEKDGPPVLARMAYSRLLLLESLLGRRRAADACRRALESLPRTGIALLEAWNDLMRAFAAFLSGEEGEEPFMATGEAFRRMGIPSGRRFVQLGLLGAELRRGEPGGIRERLKAVESEAGSGHRILSVLEPLLRAEACFALGELDRSQDGLQRAAGAIIGLPLLELDLRVESLRARLAERQGDREGARHHLHRALQARDLLMRSLPERLQRRFPDQPRFAELRRLAGRLERPAPEPLPAAGGSASGFHGMVGRSRPMERIFRSIERLRDQEIPVLITGETGTGKELAARAIHETGPRRRETFFVLHCASLPPQLFESELFGYEAGAFTGAEESQPGLLAHLAGGTLVLDEVTGLSHGTQAKLLRVLDSRAVRPLGGLDSRPLDVRFLATSSRNLETAAAEGTFRAELYYRLRGMEIHMPPLRARREDIPDLVNHFLRLHSRRLERTPPILGSKALEFLGSRDWPGNVRELEAALLRVLITTSPGVPIDAAILRELLPAPGARALFSDDQLAGRDLGELRRELDKAYLIRLFRETGGSLEALRRRLGLKRSSLYAWIRRAGIDIQALRRGM